MIFDILKIFFCTLANTISSLLQEIQNSIFEIIPIVNTLNDIRSAFRPLTIISYWTGIPVVAIFLLLKIIKSTKN